MKQPIIKILTRYTLDATRFFLIIAAAILYTKSLTIAVDPPHSLSRDVQCMSCHIVHKAPGASLTKDASNYQLCWSCHHDGGLAEAKTLIALMQATPGTSGISHKWETSVGAGVAPLNLAKGNPDNAYGLRPAAANYLAPAPDEIQSLSLNMRLRKFGNVVTCSVCHNQHGQANIPWDPYGGPYTGMKGGDSGITSSPDDTPPYDTIFDTTKSWTASWVNNYVKMTSGGNIGQIRQISSNTATSLTVSAPFPAAIAAVDGYEIIGRHFQRISDDLNQMCEDCHYYRTAATTGTNVRIYDGYKKSHPVVKIFSSAQGEERSAGLDGTQFNTAPLEPSYVYWGAQTGTRYHQDGAGCSNPTYTDESSCTGNGYIWAADNNVTNNIVVDSSKKTRCLSCHGIHYTDSSAGTIDGP